MRNKLFIALGAAIILAGAGVLAFSLQKGADNSAGNVSQEKTSVNSSAEFEKPVTMLVEDKVIYSDGLNMSVKEINDSRCKPDVQCVWAGELATTLILTGGNFKSTEEIHLGTATSPSASSNGYKFALDSATEKNVTITIKEESPAPVSFSKCLPAGIKLGDIVDASITGYAGGQPVGLHKVTVGQKLVELKATCNAGGKLADGAGKVITFYHLTGCWGNPPPNYQELAQSQQDEINKLKEKYTVIEMTCNPSGIPIQ